MIQMRMVTEVAQLMALLGDTRILTIEGWYVVFITEEGVCVMARWTTHGDERKMASCVETRK
jgi:hypothetical protein